MIITLIVSIVTVLSIIISSLIKPTITLKGIKISLFWVMALIGASILLLTKTLDFKEWFERLTESGSMNPLKILILFISMTILSIYLDVVGFFEFLASYILKKTKGTQISIFITLYIMIAILTMFTSNDIIIFTLTPFIIGFTKNAKISPVPYLVMEFICSNTWSMMFLIGNPTNIYLTQIYNIGFVEYLKVMFLPTLVSGLIEFLIIFLIFYKKLKEPMSHDCEIMSLKDKGLTAIGLTVLSIATILLVISNYISLPMYLISLVSMIVLMISTLIYSLIRKRKPLENLTTLKRASWELIPFVISMFTICLSLEKYGITKTLSDFLGNTLTSIKYGYSSILSANLFNNIPMSIMYGSIISQSDLTSTILNEAIYSSIIGSNLGAFLTPFGALAGIMWMGILKEHDIKYTYLDFIKYGIIIIIPVSLAALLTLILSI